MLVQNMNSFSVISSLVLWTVLFTKVIVNQTRTILCYLFTYLQKNQHTKIKLLLEFI